MEPPCRKPNRLPQYDYSQAGYYFITVCTRDKEPLLWLLFAGTTCGHPYYDHVIRNEADYLRIWDYIDTNPVKWREDRYFEPTQRR